MKLPLDQAIPRFQDNEERMDIFANGNSTAQYTSSGGSVVPSVQKFLSDKDTEINVGATSILTQATTQANNASASAAAAATSSTTATTQAGIAQQAAQDALNAPALESQAAANAALAEAARVDAEAARDAAQLSAGVYPTTAAGLAATTTGQYFSVPSAESAEYLILYLNNAGSDVEIKRYPSTAGLNIEAADRYVYGKKVTFARVSLSYGMGDAITEDGYHYARYSIRGAFGAVITQNAGDGFFEFDARNTVFPTINFASGAKIDAESVWYYNGQKVRRAFSCTTSGGAMAASLIETEDGSIHIPKLVATSGAVAADGVIEPIHELVPIGDSLTAAGYADVVAATLGVPLATPSSVSNTDLGITAGGGIGSQVAAQIAARFGACGLTCAISGSVLVAGSNIITAISVALLSRQSDAPGSNRTLRATIRTLGGAAVKGLLRCVQQAGGEITFSGQEYRYTFTPDSGQTLGALAADALLHIDDEGRRSRIPLIWIGTNDAGSVNFAAEVKTRIAQMVEAYRPLTKKIVIISPIHSASHPSGSAVNTAVKALNAELAALYPDLFCDVRSAYNAGSANDTPNPALTLDGIHYNSAGLSLIAGFVSSFITSKEWL